MFLLALPIALQVGLGVGTALDGGPTAIPLRAGIEWTPSDQLALGFSLLGVPGSVPGRSFCGSPCPGNASFSAISGLLTLRGGVGGFFVEGGIGIGHLITLSSDDLFENPQMEGRGSYSLLFGMGGRWKTGDHIAIGVEGLLTQWTGVSQAEHSYGGEEVPAANDLSVTGLFALGTIWFSL